ncbi:FxSxx-COOH system tetratricopeptide repeat protein [Streptomyces sp. PAN_FS17]|uniref:FxSxx-COOH system tetratricopeptide repeat protein n=1 Tax=Streptomyces sp. PAN_FS17 TaxID=1855351 RepID=UPI00089D77F1|nr:FxSxx-COOH system tetratricopeptide repeat protein [Streptomyces sp. PAN_FS17]SEB98885.1 Tetratricopeptide (TPR) repeat [Streptomyces sp. PAN_FS17]
MTDPQTPPASGGRSAAAGHSSGVIATGDRARIEQRTLVVPPDALQAALHDEEIARLSNLPAPDSRVFMGREDALAVLRELPSTGTGIVAQSVRGMGGIGKSTLVLHHAHAYLAAGHGPVWWIEASSSAAVTAGLTSLATALNPVHAALPLDEAAAWAVTWLQGRTGWLLIFDNADEPTDLRPYLGRLSTGQVLVTTRRDLPWQDLGTPLRLETLTPETALAVLKEITGCGSDRDTAALAELTKELGHLPLALQQAGAYLAQTRNSATSYLVQLRADPAGVLAATAPGDPHQRTIAQLWSVTLSSMHNAEPHAVALLEVLAYCAPEPLPRHVLANSLPTQQAVDHALGVLAAYSMITLTDSTVTVHRLVQAVVRTTTPVAIPPPQSGAIRRLLRIFRSTRGPHPSESALQLLYAATPSGRPDETQSWPNWQALLPHIQAVSAYEYGAGTASQLATMLGQAAFYLWARGLAVEALPLEERALQISETALGPGHPETAVRLGNLAATFSSLGRHAQALPMKERALQVTETALGPHHPETGVRLGNLAATLSALGRHTKALPLEERALQVTEAALGPHHPSTALRLGNLAATLGALGRHAEALPMNERALQISETALGPHHPSTALRLGNLAATLSALGRHAKALPLEERALQVTEAALGPGHPETAVRLGNLAANLGALGRHAEALPMNERALQISETALGPHHPDTALRLSNLAATLSALDLHAEALPMNERALQISETALGPDHPDTALRLGNLAATLGALDRHAEALPMNERALQVIKASLGADHPETALRLGNLAANLGALGHHAEALPMKERALQVTETALGPDHPETAARLGNLAATLSALDRYAEALPMNERALQISETALGPDHPDTALRLSNLTVIRGLLADVAPDGPESSV